MTNDEIVARVVSYRLGSPLPDLVELTELVDVVAAVMNAFGLDPDDEFVPPAQVTS